MYLKKLLLFSFVLFLLIACGAEATQNSENQEVNNSENLNENLIENNNSLENNASEEIVHDDNQIEDNSTETNETIEMENNASDMNYTDEELTLSAYDSYIRHSPSSFSAKLLSLFFKVEQPIENGVAIIKDNQAFSFELNWENPAYAKNVNFYFFNGRQNSIQYISGAIPANSESYSGSCKSFKNYRFNCKGVVVDEAKYYIGKKKPIRSSFVMAVCDRSTQDPNRICDFIRIPIEFRD